MRGSSPPVPLPNSIEKNKVVVITDGKTVSTITLFESLSKKLNKGRYYTLINYGVWKQRINVKENSKVFKTAGFEVQDVLIEQGRNMLEPNARDLEDEEEVDGELVNITGQIVKVGYQTH